MTDRIKLIASDLDGTLVDSSGQIDTDIFPLIDELYDRGVRFVACSGRQYYNLRKIFAAVADKILFVSDNGALVADNERFLNAVVMSESQVRRVVDLVSEIDSTYAVLCGVQSAYVCTDDAHFASEVSKYYLRCRRVASFDTLPDDQILKIAVYDKKGSADNAYPLLSHLSSEFSLLLSGNNWLDISTPEVNKGLAMRYIQSMLGVSPEESAAFGDQMNDIEMLRAVKYSYAVSNAVPQLRACASHVIGSNDEHSVVNTIRLCLCK